MVYKKVTLQEGIFPLSKWQQWTDPRKSLKYPCFLYQTIKFRHCRRHHWTSFKFSNIPEWVQSLQRTSKIKKNKKKKKKKTRLQWTTGRRLRPSEPYHILRFHWRIWLVKDFLRKSQRNLFAMKGLCTCCNLCPNLLHTVVFYCGSKNTLWDRITIKSL